MAALIADSARLMQADAEAKATATGSSSGSSSHNVSWRRQCYAQMFALHSPEGPAAPRPTSVYRARSLPASTSAWAASLARRAHAALLAAKEAADDTNPDADKNGGLDDVPAPPLAALRSQLPGGNGGGGDGWGGGPPSLAGLPSSLFSLGEPTPGSWGPDAASELMEGADPLVFPLSGGHTSRWVGHPPAR